MNQKISSQQRVQTAAEEAGIPIEIVEMPDSTRTAKEAASACGCEVEQIVKSLIFQGEESGELKAILVSGIHRVDTPKVAEQVGEKIGRADPKIVREVTGFAIGGVAPIGHLTDIRVWMDPHLLTLESVWAAAGKPNSVFEINSQKLKKITDAEMLNQDCLTEDT